MDGNGQRHDLKMLLARMGLNTFHLFSFENYYNTNISKYFQMVGRLEIITILLQPLILLVGLSILLMDYR